MMGFDGRAVANFILDFCDSKGRKISNLALQKIAYFCHAWSLIELGRPLVKHNFEAWEFGPVLPYLYREFKAFDKSPINGRAMQINRFNGQLEVVRYEFDEETQGLLQTITDFYSRLGTSDLVKLSHIENGPWYKVWNHQGVVNPGMKIADSDITCFYSVVSKPFITQ